ncbi:hypothetical protein Pmani_035370 [Petrolisthes manimaculis]|uniref:Uncharacterized protein n=1 Tax=Petrolisthes manimaculis TaxID=1843537 RepID=A0AAE1NKQ6_9EUCA|nr:hypothetical protein Pmani_035370 [Petrolisthes manimaculis]
MNDDFRSKFIRLALEAFNCKCIRPRVEEIKGATSMGRETGTRIGEAQGMITTRKGEEVDKNREGEGEENLEQGRVRRKSGIREGEKEYWNKGGGKGKLEQGRWRRSTGTR